MKSRTQEWILAGVVTIVSSITVVIVGTVLCSRDGWLYDHIETICLATGTAFCLVVFGIVVIWNHDKPATKALAATALIAATAATTQAGLFTPAGGDSPNSSPKGSYWSWLLHGWDFGWGFWRDGLDSWQSGHPVINIDPQPPSNNDASSK